MAMTARHHLHQLLESFDTSMLITHAGEKLHARPMAVAAVEGERTLWFVTSTSSPKSSEIREDTRVSATFQSQARFVALSGRARLVEDREKIAQLWQPAWKVWFPNGKDDPSIALIRVDVSDAEFWDNAGAKGVRYALEAAKAFFTHDTPRPDSEQHGRVKSPEVAS